MISKGALTKRANQEQLPAQTIERDYVLAHLCADIGAVGAFTPRWWSPAIAAG